jgi:hypothetical protein
MISIEMKIAKEYCWCRVYDEYENIIFSSHRWDTENTLEFMQRMTKNIAELDLYRYLISE